LTYLFDVNALIALGHDAHTLHARVEAWVGRLRPGDRIATSPITELGFVRIAAHTRLSPDVAAARGLLRLMKRSRKPRFVFLTDGLGVDALPAWVGTPGQTTDGHLAALANSHRSKLATLDVGIPGATVIA